jgi:hypothetical protein
VQFWNNNAFQHFEVEPRTGILRAPRYSFVIADGLDPAAIVAKFGEPMRREQVVGCTVWIYDDAGAARISGIVDREVRDYLGSRPGTERIASP